MKTSFLVTYYNQREYVRQSLDSILAIEKPDEWEILIGDDGSSDGTVEVVRDYINRYPNNIFLFIMPRKMDVRYDSVKRASANRINLLEHATGDCFCTLDGDDFYCNKSFVEDAIKVFDNSPETSVVSFGYKYYTDGIYSKDYVLPAGVRGHVDKKTYLKSFYLHAGACVHKLCYGKERIEYIKSIGYFDDNDIVINSLNYGEMYSIPKSIYAYRQTGQSVYTSMRELEQSVLNVQGMDVDFQLIDQSFHPDLFYRNAYSIITLYFYRKKIQELLSKEKINLYLQGVQTWNDSVCRAFLTNNIDASLKNKIMCLMLRKMKLSLKIYVKKIFG